jgi:glycosyltransferase involved in cell wall biosynthesis
MKILHLSALPVWSMDGKGGMPSLRKTLDGHVAAGHQIFLVLPRYDLFSDDLAQVTIPSGSRYGVAIADCRWLPPLKKVRAAMRRLSGGSELNYLVRWLLNMTMMLMLTISLLKCARVGISGGFRADLVYAHNQFAALAGFLTARFLKIPNVTRLYGTFLADLIKKPLVSIRYPTAAIGYRVPSNLLICANDGTRGDEVARAFKIPESRFRFWQNGVAPPKKPVHLTRKEFSIGVDDSLRIDSCWIVSCSRLSYWKRIDRMLHAVAVCKGIGIDCQLLIAGDGREREALQILTNNLGISDSVVFLGVLAHDDVWKLLNISDVFLITNDVTNRCNPLYEAILAGVPVVSIFDPSTADLLQDGINAFLAEKDDVEGLGFKLAALCKDTTLGNKLRKNQQELATSFRTWEERMKIETNELEALVAKWKARI